jgi:arginyl-tRNA synthetase
MSKRAGTFVTAREVLDEVGKDAFRFFLLTPSTQTHMDFDLEVAKKKSAENPVFYVQYAYTRIASIFMKYKTSNKNKISTGTVIASCKEEIGGLFESFNLPYLVEEVSKNLEVNALTVCFRACKLFP